MSAKDTIIWDESKASERRRCEIIDIICNKYASVQRGTIAESLCGRSIEYLHIGNKQNRVLYVGAFHGMEWITSLLLLKFAYNIAECFENNKPLSEVDIGNFLERSGLTIIPCLNPDGVEICINGAKSAGKFKELVKSVSKYTNTWQANARGVDLNHNFDAGWQKVHENERKMGIISASPTRYGGPCPESEPETKALVDFCNEGLFKHAVAYHSQGKEIYWNYGENIPHRSELMAQVMAISSGYKLGEPEEIATGGGFKDWFIEQYNKPAFTVEVGEGKNPLPITDLNDIYNSLEEMMVLCAIM